MIWFWNDSKKESLRIINRVIPNRISSKDASFFHFSFHSSCFPVINNTPNWVNFVKHTRTHRKQTNKHSLFTHSLTKIHLIDRMQPIVNSSASTNVQIDSIDQSIHPSIAFSLLHVSSCCCCTAKNFIIYPGWLLCCVYRQIDRILLCKWCLAHLCFR